MQDFNFEFDWVPSESPSYFLFERDGEAPALSPGVMLEMALGALAHVGSDAVLRAIKLGSVPGDLARRLTTQVGSAGLVSLMHGPLVDADAGGVIAMMGYAGRSTRAREARAPEASTRGALRAANDLERLLARVERGISGAPSAVRPAMQVTLSGVTGVTRVPEGLRVELGGPGQYEAEIGQYVLHPLISDLSLSLVSLAFASPEPSHESVEYAIDELTVLQPHAWPGALLIVPVESDGAVAAIDVRVVSEHGRVLAEYRGVRAQRGLLGGALTGLRAAPTAALAAPTLTESEVRARIERAIESAVPSLDLGAESTFAAQGLSSLDGLRLLSALYEELGLVVRFSDLASASSAAAFVAFCVARQRERASLARTEATGVQERPRAIPPGTLSSVQRRFWFLDHLDQVDHLEHAGCRYNLHARVRVTGTFDCVVLQQAFLHVLQRHEVLRWSFHELDGTPMARTRHGASRELVLQDLSRLPAPQREAQLAALNRAASRVRFRLSQGELVRLSIVRLAPCEHELLFTAHHIVVDGWSFGLLIDQVLAAYDDAVHGRSAGDDPVPAYAQHVHAEQAFLRSADAAVCRAYWSEQLSGTPSLRWPPEIGDPRTLEPHAAELWFPPELTQDIKALARREGVSLFVVLASMFRCVLQRLTRQQDFCIGTATACRLTGEDMRLVGPMINMLALRSHVPERATLRELLHQVRASLAEALDHQRLPFDEVVSLCAPRRRPGENPLFATAFLLEDFPKPSTRLDGASLELRLDRMDGSPEGTSRLDLELSMMEERGGLRGTLSAADGRIAPWLLRAMPECMQAVARAMFDTLDTPIAHVSLLPQRAPATPAALRPASWEDSVPVHALFEREVERHPDARAVVCDEGECTYAQLDARANQLAALLTGEGVRAGDAVVVLVRRNLDLPTALLAIMKAGAYYVPCDPRYPQARIAAIVAEVGASLVLTHQGLWPQPACGGTRVIALDALRTEISAHSERRNALAVSPHSLCYAIFTSGSTGVPKGVMIEHRNVSNLVQGMDAWVASAPEQVWLAAASASFDMCVPELLRTLCRGALMVLVEGLWVSGAERAPGEDRLGAAQRTLALARAHGVTHMQSTPSMLRVLLGLDEGRALLSELQQLLVGGEEFPAPLVCELRAATRAEIWNVYGPTETTVWSSGARIQDVLERVSIGEPLRATRLYVLDELGQPVPDGFAGELCIAGAGVARGYLGDLARTAARFVPDPFVLLESDGTPARVYKTGDLVVRTQDAGLLWLGRNDDQVKVRGFRVQVREVEVALLQCPGVRAACVFFDEQQGGRLLACIVPTDDTVTAEAIKLRLAARLPDYMVPARVMRVASLPLNQNGKLDRSKLPVELPSSTAVVTPTSAPLSAAEEIIAQAFQAVLGELEPSMHTDADFFALGGDSLLAVRLVEVLHQRGLRISLRQVFTDPTIRALARATEQADEPIDLPSRVRLSEHFESRLKMASAWPQTPGESAILMTGGTGFLGAYLVRELACRTRASIVCLVRGKSMDEAERRLHSNLQAYGIELGDDAARVRVVAGDLDQPMFGLPRDTYQRLASECGAVLHNAALVNFAYPYQRLESSNVDGTREVLDFCVSEQLKALHFVSTIAIAAATARDDDALVTEAEPLEAWQQLKDGYSQSKWVAEQMVRAAHDAGLPTAIYRPGRIVGDARTGRAPVADAITRAFAAFIDLGAGFESQDLELSDLVGVDDVASAIAALLTSGHGLASTWHITSPASVTMAQLYTWLRSFGYDIAEIPYPRFRALVAERGPSGPLFALLHYLPLEGAGPRLRGLVSAEHTVAALHPLAVSFRPYTEADLHALLRHLVDIGFIQPPSSTRRTEARQPTDAASRNA